MFAEPIHAGAAVILAMLLSLGGCARRIVHAAPPPSAPVRIGHTETGIASWYGAPYHGRAAASGEIYDMEQLTAAHRTLPFGVWVEVTDLDNGKRVQVRITDRGPFVEGRVIDLSQAAAREIGMLGPGTARVRLKVIEAPARAAEVALPTGQYAVQAGAFSDRGRAEAFGAGLRDRFPDVPATRVVEGPGVWRVLAGHQMTIEAANELAVRMRRVFGEALVVRDP